MWNSPRRRGGNSPTGADFRCHSTNGPRSLLGTQAHVAAARRRTRRAGGRAGWREARRGVHAGSVGDAPVRERGRCRRRRQADRGRLRGRRSTRRSAPTPRASFKTRRGSAEPTLQRRNAMARGVRLGCVERRVCGRTCVPTSEFLPQIHDVPRVGIAKSEQQELPMAKYMKRRALIPVEQRQRDVLDDGTVGDSHQPVAPV